MNALISKIVSWRRQIAWSAGTVVVVWLAAWLGVPPLLKSQIETRGTEALGRKLTVGAVDFKPWSLELTLTDLAIASADGATSQFQAGRVYLDAELESVLRLAPVVDAIVIDRPVLRISHLGEGHYDVDDILARLTTPKPEPEPAKEPPKFALHNISLTGGEIDFADHMGTTERQHAVRKLLLDVPFLSNISSQRDIRVTPRLAFELNGSAFDTAAEATPFAQTRKGVASLRIGKLDLAPYLPYLPQGLPVQLKGAVLDTDLRIAFEQTPKLAVSVKGETTLTQLALLDTTGKDLLAVQSIRVVLSDVRPLERVVKLESLDISAPTLQLSRNRAGRLNLQAGESGSTKNATNSIAANADSTGAGGQKDSKEATREGWQLGLNRFALHGGSVAWTDDSIAPRAQLTLANLELQAQSVAWPFADTPATFEGSMAVPSRSKAAQLAFKGSGTDAQGQAQLNLSDVSLGLAAPYLAQFLTPQVAGVLEGTVDAQWKDRQTQLNIQRLALHDAALQAEKRAAGTSAGPLPKFKLLELSQTHIDVAAKQAQIGKLTLRGANLTVARDEQGAWMFQRWLKSAAPSEAVASSASEGVSAGSAKPGSDWKVVLAEAVIDDGTVVLDDHLPARPVNATVSALNVQLKSANLDGKTAAPLSVSARVKAGQTEPGSLKFKGSVMWDPLVAQGTIEALTIPAHAFVPYVADRLNIDVQRADTSVRGTVSYATKPAGTELRLKLDAALDDFASTGVAAGAAQGVPGGEELLRWKSLNVPGIDVAMLPAAPLQVQVREVALTDFYARLIVNPQGRLNLQDLVRNDAAETKTTQTSTPASPASPASSASAVTADRPQVADPVIVVGPVSLVNGKVRFSDYFIKPNYSADLSDLTGKLSKFSSQPVDGVAQLADLELRGRAEGTASLEIAGKLNPLAKPLALDIKGKVRDLELPPLSPYAIKYAGYGIERGKLNVDVSYLVKPDGQLTANNSLVLHQLTFGDKVEGAPNSLPVKLAVSLLSDRNGVIDLNLPISGSLNDPQFSIGPIIWKIIVNVVSKALTSPFSLLASAFGGGDELSMVSFVAGSSALTPDAKTGLDKVAKALADRTGLKLTVQGTASLDVERDAVKRERLKGMVLAEKRRRVAGAGQDTAAAVTVSDAEYPVLLKEVYKRADITKPRNLVGLAKDLPTGEMEALLLANITVNDDALRELAQDRGVVVRDYLAAKKLESERLFLGAPKTNAQAADWKPRAELNLAGR